MNSLIEKIDRAIEEKAMKTGRMGTESVSVSLDLTVEEIDTFDNIDKYDNEHYWWEFEGNTLNISYTEDVK